MGMNNLGRKTYHSRNSAQEFRILKAFKIFDIFSATCKDSFRFFRYCQRYFEIPKNFQTFEIYKIFEIFRDFRDLVHSKNRFKVLSKELEHRIGDF